MLNGLISRLLFGALVSAKAALAPRCELRLSWAQLVYATLEGSLCLCVCATPNSSAPRGLVAVIIASACRYPSAWAGAQPEPEAAESGVAAA